MNADEIAIKIHDFVIAVHGDDITADLDRLSFQFLEEVKDFEFLSTTVEDVADLYKGG